MTSEARATHLLSCALTYYEADLREVPLARTFESDSHALHTFLDVLMHEARESLQEPLAAAPDNPFLHPVDVDTEDPGIVHQESQIRRCSAATLPRIVYARPSQPTPDPAPPIGWNSSDQPPVAVDASREDAEAAARRDLQRAIKRAGTRASAVESSIQRARERTLARSNETAEDKKVRLANAKQAREQKREQQREQQSQQGGIVDAARPRPSPAPKPKPPPPSEDALVEPNVSDALTIAPLRKRRANAKDVQFYGPPLPHHRHLDALRLAHPHPSLHPALLRGEAVSTLALIQGPPGTGKTRELVRMLADGAIPTASRVYMCAPTNVGAANLYQRCVAEGLGDVAALALAPGRVPLGTAVLSNDPSRRIVCSTISARSGPVLSGHAFDVVMVDEAAQCMEAWVWGLLRSEVRRLVMAGDVHQLPACVSEGGAALGHARSLMQRLMDLDYPNVTRLTTQNRMCPEIMAFPNRTFYGGCLTMGPHAPTHGCMQVVCLEDGHEERRDTSYANRVEAEQAAKIAAKMAEDLGSSDVVIITPYAAQCCAVLAQKTNLPVHTIDSFQGRESDGVVVSCVRDGRDGIGFWADERRLTVALTRARRHLTVLVSQPHQWPAESAVAALVHNNGASFI